MSQSNDHLLAPLFALSADLMCVIGEGGRFRRVNPAFDTLGYPATELLGMTLAEVTHPDDRHAVVDALASGRDDVRFESRLRCKNGTHLTMSWHLMRDARASVTYGIARDITERKWIEAELKASLSLVQATLESTADGILVIDGDDTVVTYNRKLVEMWRMPDAVVDARDASAIYAHVSAEVTGPGLEPVASDQTSYQLLESKDGRVFEAHSQPRFIGDVLAGRVWSFRDVTERVRAERTVREHLIMGLEHAVEGICRVDDRGRYLSVNPVFAALVGYEKGELIGKPWTDTIVEEDRARALDAYQQMLKVGKVELEARAARKDGSTLHLRALMVSSSEDGGDFGHHYFVKDISEQKDMQERLLLTDRMASMGTLAAGVAHEINNPLAYVMANVSVLIDELPGLRESLGDERAHEMQEILNDVRDGAERVSRIVRDLKVFSRPDDTPSAAVDVRRVLEFSINIAYNEIKHRARLVKDYGDTPLVDANDAQLGQVCLNLLVNAAQAIREGDVHHNEIRIVTGTAPDGRAFIEVRDTGCGIPASNLSRIFDPFFTTKPVGMGTGLGLSVCHGIVSKLGGEITVESEVGKGTVFRVLLRRAKGVHSMPAMRSSIRPAVPRGRVLVVDDEPILATALRRVLEKEHDVVACTSGRAALEALASAGSPEGAAPFDVIVCDLMMPEMTGMDLYAELRRSQPAYADRMVFMTGGVFTVRAKGFLEQVPNPRFEKPIDFQGLRATIRALVSARSAALKDLRTSSPSR